MGFWARLELLLGSGEVVIDRPQGSTHPRYPDVVYPLDYGYVEGTRSGDGQEVDVWRGSLPGASLVGIVCTVDTRKGDTEIKLLVGCTEQEIEAIVRFHDDGDGMSAITVRRDTVRREEKERS